MDYREFQDLTHNLLGKEVGVITIHGTFGGTLLFAGNNFITMCTRIKGRLVKILIRTKLIVAMFRNFSGGTGGSFEWSPSRDTHSEDDALTNYIIIESEFVK